MEGIVNSFLISEEEARLYANKIFKKLDKNKNGCLDYSEFVLGTLNINNIIREDNIKKLFQEIDKNNDGYISEKELQFLLKSFNHNC